jgi:hypothetical protein
MPNGKGNWFQEKVSCDRPIFHITLDLWSYTDIFFYETFYSIYTLLQASRRSWRIGQRSNVNVKFLYYAGTMPEAYWRLMGRKLLVSLTMGGRFVTEGLRAINDGDDILMALARELVTEKGTGSVPEGIILPVAPIPGVVTQLLMFGISQEMGQRCKAPQTSEGPRHRRINWDCSKIEKKTSRCLTRVLH